MPDSVYAQTDFIADSFNLVLLSAGIDEIISEALTIVSSETTLGIAPASYLNQSVTYSPFTPITSNVSFRTNILEISLLEGNSYNTFPDLSCSFSGSTSISFSIVNDMGGPAPSWVTINPNTGELSITAPVVSTGTKYYLFIESNIAGVPTPIQKMINLTIKKWLVPSWQKWSNISDMIWENWKIGYTLSSGSWNSFSSNHDNQLNDVGKALGIGSQSVIGIVGWVMIWLCLTNSSTMASFWSLVNESQLFFINWF